ncbi:hypothetical protein BDW67DRAFT_92410 [Aspergillus spinulosporus]
MGSWLMSAPTLAVGFTGSHYHHSETTTFSPPPSATGLSKPPHFKIPTSPSSSTPSQLRSTPTLVLPINSVDCLLLEPVVVAVAACSCLLRRISTDHRHPHDPKGLPEEEKIIPSTDSFSSSTFVSPGCQSLVPLSPATNRSVSLGTDPRCDLIPPPSPDLGSIIIIPSRLARVGAIRFYTSSTIDSFRSNSRSRVTYPNYIDFRISFSFTFQSHEPRLYSLSSKIQGFGFELRPSDCLRPAQEKGRFDRKWWTGTQVHLPGNSHSEFPSSLIQTSLVYKIPLFIHKWCVMEWGR